METIQFWSLKNVGYLFIIITPSPLWPAVVVPITVTSLDQIERFNLLLGIIINTK